MRRHGIQFETRPSMAIEVAESIVYPVAVFAIVFAAALAGM